VGRTVGGWLGGKVALIMQFNGCGLFVIVITCCKTGLMASVVGLY